MSQAKLPHDSYKDKEKSVEHLPCVVCNNTSFQRKRHLPRGSLSVDLCAWSSIDSIHSKKTVPPDECYELYIPYLINK